LETKRKKSTTGTYIQFKPDFELKLKRMRIKSKFLKELRNHINRELLLNIEEGNAMFLHGALINRATHRNIDSAIILNRLKHWRQFITLAFAWEETEDGYQYWNEILKK